MERRAADEPRFVVSVQEAGRPARMLRVVGKVSVGRSRKNDVVVDDPRVSLRHAEITLDANAVRAADLATTNGTWLARLERDGPGAPQRVDANIPVLLRQGDELRLGDPDGPRVVLEVEPVVVGELVAESDADALAQPPRASRLAKLLARVDVEGVVASLAGIAFDTFAEVENVLVWGSDGEEPIYVARRTRDGFERVAHAPPFSRTVLARVRSDAATVVFGTPLQATIDSESLRHAQILAGFCAPLTDGEGRVVGVLEADSRRRNWAPEETTLREVAKLARFAGRVAAVALHAEAERRRAQELERERERLRRELGARASLFGIVGRDPRIVEQLEVVERVAPLDAPVLVLGETGTGKELFARALHDRSPRAKGPFIAVNCAALPKPLLESELFGYERGAFTGAERSTPGLFERAAGGTLFLDEVGEAHLDLQASLLRAIERREVRRLGSHETRAVDVRIVCATNKDLEAEVAAGSFRRDLFFRIGAIPIRLPPLRERRGDIPDLVAHFVEQLRVRLGRPDLRVSPEAMRVLIDESWAGNVRELENRLLRGAVLSPDGAIEPAHVAAAHQARVDRSPTAEARNLDAPLLPLREARDAFLRAHVARALELSRGNRREAARLLATDASNLARTMRRLGMLGGKEEGDEIDEDE